VEVAHLATAHLLHQATTLLVSPAAIDVYNYSLALPIEAVPDPARPVPPENLIPPMRFRPVNFPVEDGQLLTQREILCHERCPWQNQAPDEQKEGLDEGHKCEANQLNQR